MEEIEGIKEHSADLTIKDKEGNEAIVKIRVEGFDEGEDNTKTVPLPKEEFVEGMQEAIAWGEKPAVYRNEEGPYPDATVWYRVEVRSNNGVKLPDLEVVTLREEPKIMRIHAIEIVDNIRKQLEQAGLEVNLDNNDRDIYPNEEGNTTPPDDPKAP